MKKILLTFLAFVLFIPFALAEESSVVSYQKLKNVTKKDHPAGSNLTMGFAGDEIRFLVFVQNKTATKTTLKIVDILPESLVYQANTTYRYQLGSGGDWQKIPDLKNARIFPLQDHIITIEPGVGYYFKFVTIVADNIPTNNFTLANFVTVYNSANKVLKQTVTKVLVPNSTVKSVQTELNSEEAEGDYINQVLGEEQKFIEKTFFELEERGFEGELPQTEILDLEKNTENETAIPAENSKFNWLWGTFGMIVFLFLLFLTRKNRF